MNYASGQFELVTDTFGEGPQTEHELPLHYCAIGGSSVFLSAKRTLEGDGAIDYYQLLDLAEFLDSLVTHEQVVFIGRFDDSARAFADTMNQELRPGSVLLIDSEASWLEDMFDTDSFAHGFRDLVSASFASRPLDLSPSLLGQRPHKTRETDERTRAYRDVLATFEGEELSEYDTLELWLLQEFHQSIVGGGESTSIRYLLRTFLYMALARELRGSVMVDSLRIPVAALADVRIGHASPRTFPRLFYDHVNLAWAEANRPLRGHTANYPFTSLALSYVGALGFEDRGQLLSRMVELREYLNGFRTEMTDVARTLGDPETSVAKRVQTHNSFIGNTLRYLEDINLLTGTLSLVQSIWFASLDSLGASSKISLNDEGAVDREFEGTLRSSAVRALVKTAREHASKSNIRTLLEMVKTVVEERAPGHNVREVLPIEGLGRQDQAFERFLWAVRRLSLERGARL